MLDLPIKEQKAAVKELDDEIGRFESKTVQIDALRERMENLIVDSLL
jgi:hypothetical protein